MSGRTALVDEAATAENLQPQTAKGRATRQAILDAAQDVFGELGFAEASISEITRRAGVAQGTFYLYFPDKRSAFVELVHQLNHDVRFAIREAITGLDDRIEMERVGFQTFFEFMSDHKALNRIVRESEFVSPETYQWHYATFFDRYVQRLEDAQAKRQITDEISAGSMAWLLLGIAEFLGAHYVVWEGRQPPEEVFEDIMRFITRAIQPDGQS